MLKEKLYFPQKNSVLHSFNRFDGLALILVLTLLVILAWAATGMTTPYQVGEVLPISTDPSALPAYSIRTVLRMLIALCFSFLFTFTVGTLAAKNKQAERLIIPMIDILQSVPVLSFLSITVVGFIHLFPNRLLGPECASIFAIFTAQVWNMTLGFYQTVKTVPKDLIEASDVFQLSPWQRFWRVEVPFSMPGLLWNTMMSMSASWFFVVASEAISVSNQTIKLPGIGSYIKVAIDQANLTAVGYAIITMFIVIILYDQLLFRPLLKWSEKFLFEQLPSEKIARSWVFNCLRRTQFLRYLQSLIERYVIESFINCRWLSKSHKRKSLAQPSTRYSQSIWRTATFLLAIGSFGWLAHYVLSELSFHDVLHTFLLGLATATRVMMLIVLSSVIWIPIGVWIGMRPRVAQFIQPIAQILAAFPANLFFPLVVMLIVKYQLNVEIWTSPLIILGSQWYIVFNVIAGTSTVPKDLYHAAANMGLKGWLWWKRFILPAIFPYFVTGAITAAGGAWNASIVAELVSWGGTTLHATGLGEYIAQYSALGDFPRIVLGTGMMCVFVLAFNHFLWRPLYQFAETRYHL